MTTALHLKTEEVEFIVSELVRQISLAGFKVKRKDNEGQANLTILHVWKDNQKYFIQVPLKRGRWAVKEAKYGFKVARRYEGLKTAALIKRTGSQKVLRAVNLDRLKGRIFQALLEKEKAVPLTKRETLKALCIEANKLGLSTTAFWKKVREQPLSEQNMEEAAKRTLSSINGSQL